jgi:hypothetical protein
MESFHYGKFHNHCRVRAPITARFGAVSEQSVDGAASSLPGLEPAMISGKKYAILLTINFKSYIVYLTHQTISNKKIVNCEIVDLVKYYNFDLDFISIQHC